ncbi:hypothetical protein EIP86_000597 [Pleurotus ostreatoroseus]|nr:hypothetical protein EIP86_000597 [Pleurotus ostreatoroseus]
MFIDMLDEDDLHSLSCVSKSWAYHAQTRLFQQIHIVAGPRCVQWRKLRPPKHGLKAKILPDTFEEKYADFATLDPDLLKHVKTVTFRGLSREERRQAYTWSMGFGDDPYITLCTIVKFLRRLPNVHTIRLDGVGWGSCIPAFVEYDHSCMEDGDKRQLQLISLDRVDHKTSEDNVFEILDVAQSCDAIAIEDVQWRVFFHPFQVIGRPQRTDVRNLTVRLPHGIGGGSIVKRYPRFAGLVSIELADLGKDSGRGFRNLLRNNAATLQSLRFTARHDGEILPGLFAAFTYMAFSLRCYWVGRIRSLRLFKAASSASIIRNVRACSQRPVRRFRIREHSRYNIATLTPIP